ncbi:MAG: methyltransferase domain-containing protein [Anaerolineales bacterium]|jgi:SAM-dependent methyltransferase
MSLKEVHTAERKKWNALALKASSLPTAILSPEDNFRNYARKASTLVGVAEFLGDLGGERVLEYGCGLGEISCLLANSGANVTTFDLSENSARVTQSRAIRNDLATEIDLSVAVGESLPYAEESFNVVFGRAILHHLHVGLGWGELHRVLKPGGKAAFVEPMGMNPVLNFVRDHVPYPLKNPRGADHPLDYQDIHDWGKAFSKFRFREIQLFSMFERGLGFNRPIPFLRKLDEVVLKYLPFLRRYCRYVVLYMIK